MDEIVQFDFPTDSPKIIKVIGVGGGGGNAVNHFSQALKSEYQSDRCRTGRCKLYAGICTSRRSYNT